MEAGMCTHGDTRGAATKYGGHRLMRGLKPIRVQHVRCFRNNDWHTYLLLAASRLRAQPFAVAPQSLKVREIRPLSIRKHCETSINRRLKQIEFLAQNGRPMWW